MLTSKDMEMVGASNNFLAQCGQDAGADTMFRARSLSLVFLGVFVLGCGAGRVSFGSDGDAGIEDAQIPLDGQGGDGATTDSGLLGDGGWQVDVTDPCSGVDCSGHGTCAVSGGKAVCSCDSGYHAEGLACIEDDPCSNVTCGANAHCVAGACQCDDGYEGDPVAGCREPNPTEAQVRQELVDIALAEVGQCEDGNNDRPYMLGQPGLWCYDFVAWVYNQSSTALPSPISLPQHSASQVPDQFMPEPGDLIKFTIQHFGMVRSVSADGQTIHTVEGNFNSCVTTRTVSLGSIEYFGSLETVLNP